MASRKRRRSDKETPPEPPPPSKRLRTDGGDETRQEESSKDRPEEEPQMTAAAGEAEPAAAPPSLSRQSSSSAASAAPRRQGSWTSNRGAKTAAGPAAAGGATNTAGKAQRHKPRRDSAPAAAAAAAAGGTDASAAGKSRKPARFALGNYPRFSGLTAGRWDSDPRVTALPAALFRGKTCLDIGCNTGAVALSIAHAYEDARVDGIDVDAHLVQLASHNLDVLESLLCACDANLPMVPISLPSSAQRMLRRPDRPLHARVTFHQSNFVTRLACIPAAYDVVLCLKVSKWIHLQHGDAGLRLLFDKAYETLRPQGVFIFQPHEWRSYREKHKGTPEQERNFHSIRMLPAHFNNVLIREVGFQTCDPVQFTQADGTRSTLYIYRK